MNLRRFSDADALAAAVAGEMAACLRLPGPGKPGLMLSGGRTPLAAYARLAASDARASPAAWCLFTDERLVPPESPDSNQGQARAMLEAIGLPRTRLVAVQPGLPPNQAASRYDADLASFLAAGGRIRLGLLGLGADGHTASLFPDDDLARGSGRWAIPVTRPEPPHRVSVTPRLLERADRLLVLAVGPDKADVVRRLLEEPNTLVAGRALARARAVELWTAP